MARVKLGDVAREYKATIKDMQKHRAILRLYGEHSRLLFHAEQNPNSAAQRDAHGRQADHHSFLIPAAVA